MPYISKFYWDSDNKDKNIDEANRSGLEEMAAGHIPVYFRKGRLFVEFYVSRDVSINHILTSSDDTRFKGDLEGMFYMTYNTTNDQYQDSTSFEDKTSPLVEIVKNKDVKVFIMFLNTP